MQTIDMGICQDIWCPIAISCRMVIAQYNNPIVISSHGASDIDIDE